MTEAGAVVNMVALHDEASELLLDVAVLVGGLGRSKSSKGIAAILGKTRGYVFDAPRPIRRG